MRKGDKKSTPEQITEIRKLYRQGVSLSEIGRRIGRTPATIYYWCKDIKKHPKRFKKMISRVRSAVKKSALKEKSENKVKPCRFCGRITKEKAWEKTRYHCLKCWELATSKKNSNQNH